MAAPFVSGVAAMIKLDDSSRSIRDIERLLKKYVDDLGAIGWRLSGWLEALQISLDTPSCLLDTSRVWLETSPI